jgi:hypothetical protein
MGDRKLLNIELRRVTAKEYKELPPSGIVADYMYLCFSNR